ncbi:MAG: hypothetical protein AAGM16_13430 [Pseudomonadota bacterium]
MALDITAAAIAGAGGKGLPQKGRVLPGLRQRTDARAGIYGGGTALADSLSTGNRPRSAKCRSATQNPDKQLN